MEKAAIMAIKDEKLRDIKDLVMESMLNGIRTIEFMLNKIKVNYVIDNVKLKSKLRDIVISTLLNVSVALDALK